MPDLRLGVFGRVMVAGQVLFTVERPWLLGTAPFEVKIERYLPDGMTTP